jgi:hypothetical protein
MDATIAVSESGANTLMQKYIALASVSKSDSASWGPFTVGYNVNVALSGGTVELVNAPLNIVRLHNINVAGNVGAFFTFDLGAILPTVCIPPFQVCVNIPFIGEVCTPQVCITWPKLTVPVNLPFSVNLSADFGVSVRSIGPNWEVDLLVFPFSLFIDLSPMAGVIISEIQTAVSNALSVIPGIGSLIASLINSVLSTLNGVLSAMLSGISSFIHDVILLLDLFSPVIPVPLLTFSKTQAVLPAGLPLPPDPEVDLTIASLGADIEDHEMVVAADFA